MKCGWSLRGPCLNALVEHSIISGSVRSGPTGTTCKYFLPSGQEESKAALLQITDLFGWELSLAG